MKSMTKLMVVAMLLVAALVVTPVAARDIDNTGTTVYVGEKNVNLTAALNGTDLSPFNSGNLVFYSSIQSTTAGNCWGRSFPYQMKDLPPNSRLVHPISKQGSEPGMHLISHPRAS